MAAKAKVSIVSIMVGGKVLVKRRKTRLQQHHQQDPRTRNPQGPTPLTPTLAYHSPLSLEA